MEFDESPPLKATHCVPQAFAYAPPLGSDRGVLMSSMLGTRNSFWLASCVAQRLSERRLCRGSGDPPLLSVRGCPYVPGSVRCCNPKDLPVENFDKIQFASSGLRQKRPGFTGWLVSLVDRVKWSRAGRLAREKLVIDRSDPLPRPSRSIRLRNGSPMDHGR